METGSRTVAHPTKISAGNGGGISSISRLKSRSLPASRAPDTTDEHKSNLCQFQSLRDERSKICLIVYR